AGGAAGVGGAAGRGGAAGLGGVAGAAGAAGARAPGVTVTATGITTKTTALRFFQAPGLPPIETGLLEDIHIIPDLRTNTLIIAAPAASMELLARPIAALDREPAIRAEINVFQLKRADATTLATGLNQLFLGTAGGPGGATFPGGAAGAAGVGGAAGAAGFGGGAAGFGGAGGAA